MSAPSSGSCRCYSPSVLALCVKQFGMLVTSKLTRIWSFHVSTDHIRALIKGFDSKLAGAENFQLRQLGMQCDDWGLNKLP
jgi:hypothetical protein